MLIPCNTLSHNHSMSRSSNLTIVHQKESENSNMATSSISDSLSSIDTLYQKPEPQGSESKGEGTLSRYDKSSPIVASSLMCTQRSNHDTNMPVSLTQSISDNRPYPQKNTLPVTLSTSYSSITSQPTDLCRPSNSPTFLSPKRWSGQTQTDGRQINKYLSSKFRPYAPVIIEYPGEDDQQSPKQSTSKTEETEQVNHRLLQIGNNQTIVSDTKPLSSTCFSIKRPWSPLDPPRKDHRNTTPDPQDSQPGSFRRHSEGAVYLSQLKRPQKMLRQTQSTIGILRTDDVQTCQAAKLESVPSSKADFSSLGKGIPYTCQAYQDCTQIHTYSPLAQKQSQTTNVSRMNCTEQHCGSSPAQFPKGYFRDNYLLSTPDTNPDKDRTISSAVSSSTPLEGNKNPQDLECPPPPPKRQKLTAVRRPDRVENVTAMLSSEQRHPKSRTRRRLLELDFNNPELDAPGDCFKEPIEPDEVAQPHLNKRPSTPDHSALKHPRNISGASVMSDNQNVCEDAEAGDSISDKSEPIEPLPHCKIVSNRQYGSHLVSLPVDNRKLIPLVSLSNRKYITLCDSKNSSIGSDSKELRNIYESEANVTLRDGSGGLRQRRSPIFCQYQKNPLYTDSQQYDRHVVCETHRKPVSLSDSITASSPSLDSQKLENHYAPDANTHLKSSPLGNLTAFSGESHTAYVSSPFLTAAVRMKPEDYPVSRMTNAKAEVSHLYLTSSSGVLSAPFDAPRAADSITSPEVFSPLQLVSPGGLLSSPCAVGPSKDQALSPPLAPVDLMMSPPLEVSEFP